MRFPVLLRSGILRSSGYLGLHYFRKGLFQRQVPCVSPLFWNTGSYPLWWKCACGRQLPGFPRQSACRSRQEYDVVMPFGSNITSTSGKESIVSENLMQTPFTLVTIDGRDTPSLNSLHVGMRYAAAHCRAEIYGENINKTELPAAEEAPDQTV